MAQPQEKGKVEKGAIHYIRHNFWPLRIFRDLTDLQAQANQWRDQVANVRVHTTTGQPPTQRFDPKAMRALPTLLPDCRDTAQAKVHTDFSIRFDGNTYTVPPWLIGKSITVKADHHHLTCYVKDKAVATHLRCWQRKQRIALPQHREAAQKHHRRHWYSQEVAAFISLGETAKRYLDAFGHRASGIRVMQPHAATYSVAAESLPNRGQREALRETIEEKSGTHVQADTAPDGALLCHA